MIACVAIVGKSQEPLFVRIYTDAGPEDAETTLRLQTAVHASLDLLQTAGEGPSSASATLNRTGGKRTDMYLGYICPVDEYRIYAYITGTQVRIIAALEDSSNVREPDLSAVSGCILSPELPANLSLSLSLSRLSKSFCSCWEPSMACTWICC